jgi:hypothetical protein
MSDLVRITGLWEGRTKDGDEYFSGRLTPTSRLLIFRNNRKEGANPPDFVCYIAPAERKDDDEEEAT